MILIEKKMQPVKDTARTIPFHSMVAMRMQTIMHRLAILEKKDTLLTRILNVGMQE